ncbi:MAG: GH32 C-terminal domain-containing protein [Planctomycetes bacterium]|nr:GH32 C-terminal domain-containing protein [Planctomycetota bacterium]
MKIFRMPAGADSTGDAIPYFHNGTYHIFSLTSPKGTTVYPARLRTTWDHHISTDLVNWTQLPSAIRPGDADSDPDASGIWTGDVIFGEGMWHAFSTGYSLKQRFQQTICHATSPDGVVWTKDPANPILTPRLDEYEDQDWRDPYVFWNDEDGMYWMILLARLKGGPHMRRGCVVLYRSRDLKAWEYYGPLYAPYHTSGPECPEMYRMGRYWYLSYSRFSEWTNTVYRIANSPFGPWRTPKYDGIGGRRFYAAKSLVNDEGRRFYFGWAHDRGDRSDVGDWYWGGAFCIPHEVKPMAGDDDGELAVFMPKEYVDACTTPVPWEYKHVWGEHTRFGPDNVVLDSPGTLSYGFVTTAASSFLFRCTIRVDRCLDHFGLVLKSDEAIATSLLLTFDRSMDRVALVNMPQRLDPFWQESTPANINPREPGPDGPRVAEKAFPFKDGDEIDVKVAIDNDMVEIFVGEKVAFTYRSYAKAEYEIGLLAQDASVGFYGIRLDT